MRPTLTIGGSIAGPDLSMLAAGSRTAFMAEVVQLNHTVTTSIISETSQRPP
jgi:hypothetical protein